MRAYGLVLGILAVWRLGYILYAENGPWDVVLRLRHVAGQGGWGRLMDCFQCLSFWIALPIGLYLGESWGERLLLWPALSAGAIVLERVTSRPQNEQVSVRPKEGAEER